MRAGTRVREAQIWPKIQKLGRIQTYEHKNF